MDDLRRSFRALLSELSRRHVLHAAAVYAVVAWMVMEVASVVLPALRLPEWTVTLVVVLALLGFPLVLTLEWVFELTSEGVRRTATLPAPDALPAGARVGRSTTTRVVLAFGLGTMAALAGSRVAGVYLERWSGNGASAALRSVAVLPFASLGASPEEDYFAGGVHDQILAKLARVRDLRVISRTSVLAYADTRKNLREVGRELGVGAIVEGTVLRSGERVRITVQLIDARSDVHLWAETYDRRLTDVFAIQSEIAQQIVATLQARLSPAERARLVSQPTRDLVAYDAYVRGVGWLRRGLAEENLRQALAMYERAVERDPHFALAYAELAMVHGTLYWFAFDRTAARLDRFRSAAGRALALNPELPEAHRAMGYYHYWAHRDYDRALEEFAIAGRGMPNDPETRRAVAFIHRRQGRFREAVDQLEQAFARSPLSADLAFNLAGAHLYLRDYPAAARLLERAIALEPEHEPAYLVGALLELLWRGDAERARAVLGAAPVVPAGSAYVHFLGDRTARDYRAGLERLRVAPPLLEGQWWFYPRPLLTGWLHAALGDATRARAAYDSARSVLEAGVRAEPEDARRRSALGLAYAGLGRRAEAIREGERAVELLPVTSDAVSGPDHLLELAQIYATVGEEERAVALLERLLSIPSPLSRAWLEKDPRWDPLRGHRGFRRLVGSD